MDVCKKKVVHLCLGNFYVDGYSYQENLLPKYHVKLGYDVSIIASLRSYDKNGVVCYLKEGEYVDCNNGCRIIRINYKKGIFGKLYKKLRFFSNTYNLLLREKPDIIFVHNTGFGDAKWVKKYMDEHPDTVLFADSHADWINSGRNFLSKYILHKIIWRHYTLMLLPYYKKVYGVLPLRCDFLHDVYSIPKEKIELLPLGVDDDDIPFNKDEVRNSVRQELGIENNDLVIITGGKINSLKNTHKLMQAFSEISNEKVHLVIFGVVSPDFENEFVKYLSNNIHYIGWCSSNEVIRIMLSADLACFPGTHSTLWEEAVGLSLPCIFKYWEGIHHVDINGNCIFLDDDAVEDIKKALTNALCCDTLKELKNKAEMAAKHFRYSEIAKKAIAIL